jgi:hypothetical protein
MPLDASCVPTGVILSAMQHRAQHEGLPYKTYWLNFTEIEPEMKKLGLSEYPASSLIAYTRPTIYDPNRKRVVNDSAIIAEYLDEKYPDFGPALFPPRTAAIQRAFVDQDIRAIADTFPAFVNITVDERMRQEILPHVA